MKKDMVNHIKKYIHLLEVDVKNGIILNRKESIGTSGYKRITLKDRTIYSHQIIAFKIHGMRCWGCVVNHKDGDKLNNEESNLEVIFQRENMLHAFDIGLNRSGEQHEHSTISNEDVIKMHRLYHEEGKSFYQIGKMFGKHGQTISNIVHGKSRRQQYNEYHVI